MLKVLISHRMAMLGVLWSMLNVMALICIILTVLALIEENFSLSYEMFYLIQCNCIWCSSFGPGVEICSVVFAMRQVFLLVLWFVFGVFWCDKFSAWAILLLSVDIALCLVTRTQNVSSTSQFLRLIVSG